MKFEPKMSGTRVTGFPCRGFFHSQIITLAECMEKIKRQETMDYLLDTFRFSLCTDGQWRAVIGYDDDEKIAILEGFPECEKEMIEYFGSDWLKHYIRFGH